MSRYVWVGAAALLLLTAALLFWMDRADEPTAPPLPAFHAPDGGELRPHPDRAGLPRRRPTQ
jgi:hypothetical protein